MYETTAKKIKRIQAEIGKLQTELDYLILGGQSTGVSFNQNYYNICSIKKFNSNV